MSRRSTWNASWRALHGFMLFNKIAARHRFPSWGVAEILARLPATHHATIAPGLSASDRNYGVTLLAW